MNLLIEKIKQTKNPTVVGLDPKLEYIPDDIRARAFAKLSAEYDAFECAADAIFEFNKGLIDALCDIVPAVKPQSAYYEMYGWQGVRTLWRTIEYAKSKGMYVIADCKRGDIGATSEAYATAYLGNTIIEGSLKRAFDADSLTVNPYLGSDGVLPFADVCKDNDKSIFVLVKTSNKSSGELQDLKAMDNGQWTMDNDCANSRGEFELNPKPVYEIMAELVNSWGADSIGECGYSNVGAVVGATYPEQAEKLRKLMPNTYFLVPGYGAQGGTAADVAKSFNADGLGAIVNASRSIMCSYMKDGGDFQSAARAEAIRMRDDIVTAINN